MRIIFPRVPPERYLHFREVRRSTIRIVLAYNPDDLDATNRLGHVYRLRGDLVAARTQYERLSRIAPNDESWRSISLGNLGAIALTRSNLKEAERFHRESLALDLKLGRLEGQASQLGNLGAIAKARGNFAEARKLWLESHNLFAQVGLPHMVERSRGWIDRLPREAE